MYRRTVPLSKGVRKMVRVKIAPDVEFMMEVELKGIDHTSRDHEVQLHKAEVYAEFMERMKKAFPESDIRVDSFLFGLEREQVAAGTG
jgi:hypothetical protein